MQSEHKRMPNTYKHHSHGASLSTLSLKPRQNMAKRNTLMTPKAYAHWHLTELSFHAPTRRHGQRESAGSGGSGECGEWSTRSVCVTITDLREIGSHPRQLLRATNTQLASFVEQSTACPILLQGLQLRLEQVAFQSSSPEATQLYQSLSTTTCTNNHRLTCTRVSIQKLWLLASAGPQTHRFETPPARLQTCSSVVYDPVRVWHIIYRDPGNWVPFSGGGRRRNSKTKFEDEIRPSRNLALKTKFGTEDEIRPQKPKFGPEA